MKHLNFILWAVGSLLCFVAATIHLINDTPPPVDVIVLGFLLGCASAGIAVKRFPSK